MRKLIVAVVAAGVLAGPLSAVANAGIVCTLQEKLGVENVKECEDYLP
ncbi:MAG: hypothetical protein ACRDJI_07800 [Actinomycetota bacterium]